MKLTCYGSGSTGNSYLLETEGSKILLDAGIQLDKLSCNLNEIEFAFISHEHRDHSLETKNLASRGTPIISYSPSFHIHCGYLKNCAKVYTMSVKHGEVKCCGLIIKGVNECILYMTDFTVCVYDLSEFHFTQIIVECNYDDDIIDGILKKHIVGKLPNETIKYDAQGYKYLRQINTHMSTKGLINFLDKLSLDKCKCIYLCHFSPEVGEPILAASQINQRYKKQVGVCLQRGGIDFYG